MCGEWCVVRASGGNGEWAYLLLLRLLRLLLLLDQQLRHPLGVLGLRVALVRLDHPPLQDRQRQLLDHPLLLGLEVVARRARRRPLELGGARLLHRAHRRLGLARELGREHDVL